MTEKEIIVLPVTREIIEKTMLNTQKSIVIRTKHSCIIVLL